MSLRLQEAVRKHREGQLDLAEAVYRDVLAGQPNDPDALHFLGLLLHQRGDSERAIRSIEQALRIVPEYTDALKNLGNIHQECGDPAAAEICYRRALALDEDDADAWNNLCIALKNQRRYREAVTAGRRAVALDPAKAANWLSLGNALAKAGQLERATDAYRQALQRDRRFVPAHVELCHVLYRISRTEGTAAHGAAALVEAYREWLREDPDSPIARFMLAACEGGQPAERAPDDFVRELFDGFADSFDQNLATLDYRVPSLVERHIADDAWFRNASLVVLDAGCGTGLCGPFLKSVASRLTGVDLSPGMLRKAASRGVYDELVEAELGAFLEDAEARFDLIVAADTLVYFGELKSVLRAAANALRPRGRLLFTLEHLAAGEEHFRLNPSGRYAHSSGYVRQRLQAAGFEAVRCSPVVLRRESGQAVQGLLIQATVSAGQSVT